jgi:cell division transport system permease protein
MIGAWLAPRLDLPLGHDASGRFLPLIIALMVYLTGLGGIGLLLLGDTVRDYWSGAPTATLTVQVPAETSAARLETLLALLRQTPGVAAVKLLGPEDTAKLVEPWLGPSVAVDRLPLPRLIDLEVDPDRRPDLTVLRQRMNQIAPESRLDDHRLALSRLRGFAERLQQVIAVALAMVAALLVLTVVFVARTGLAMHQSVIEVLHLLGAPDRYIARQFQRHAWWLGVRGGVVGGIAAAVTVIVVARAGSALELPVPIAVRGLADWRLWVLLAATAIAAGVAAMVTARATVLRRLARIP